jgi:hypothetical protein
MARMFRTPKAVEGKIEDARRIRYRVSEYILDVSAPLELFLNL